MRTKLPAAFAPVEQRRSAQKPRSLSIYWHRTNPPTVYLSSGAMEAIGQPEFITIGFDATRGQLAIVRARPDDSNAIAVSRHGGGAKFSLGALATHLTPMPGTSERFELIEVEPGLWSATIGARKQ